MVKVIREERKGMVDVLEVLRYPAANGTARACIVSVANVRMWRMLPASARSLSSKAVSVGGGSY
jgi:hypothetical protein